MKIKLYMLLASTLLCSAVHAEDYLISTRNTSLLLSATPGEKARFQYYGTAITPDDIPDIYSTGLAFNAESYPVFGLNTAGERAMAVTQADGNMTLDLAVEEVKKYDSDDG